MMERQEGRSPWGPGCLNTQGEVQGGKRLECSFCQARDRCAFSVWLTKAKGETSNCPASVPPALLCQA